MGVILFFALIANGLMAVFNFVYNKAEIISRGQLPEDAFMRTQAIINGVAFPLGIALFLRIGWPLGRGLQRLRAGQPLSVDRLRELRRLCLRLGKDGAALCLTCWLLAGFAYPIAMHTALEQVSWPVFVHFLSSLALCGLVAAAYPFFTSTFLAVRGIYPALLRPGAAVPEDIQDLRRVTHWLAGYLIVAASVPLLALTVLSFLSESGSRILQGILGLGGLIGFFGVFALSAVIRADVEALTEVVQPIRAPR